MTHNIAARTSFENFLQGWMIRQEQYLDQLITVLQQSSNNNGNDHHQEQEIRGLVERVLLHYQDYYQAKLGAVHADVFLMFSPPWFSAYERTFLWIAGFKPSLLFRLVNKSVRDLTGEQVRRMERLKADIRAAEKLMNDKHARVQESVTSAQLVEMAMRGEGDMENAAVFQRLREVMEMCVVNADLVRMTAVRELVEILNALQAVKFLAAVAEFHSKVRMCGVQRQRRPD